MRRILAQPRRVPDKSPEAARPSGAFDSDQRQRLGDSLKARKQQYVIETRKLEHAGGKRYGRSLTQQASQVLSTARVGIRVVIHRTVDLIVGTQGVVAHFL